MTIATNAKFSIAGIVVALLSARKISFFQREMLTLSLCLSFCHATLTLENVSTLFVPAIRIVESVAEQRDDCKHTVCLRSSTVET